ncbi:MAG: hypothetical protein H0T51_20190 [Pirellulales bacterium]|nr:hypothetical protein [Pirellulales bacterium]
MSTQLQDVRTDFDWQPQPAAAELVGSLLARCIQSNPQIGKLGERMRDETGTRLVDWIDSITLVDAPALHNNLTDAGYAVDDADAQSWRHPEGIFPVVRLIDRQTANGAAGHAPLSLAIKVSSVDDFAAGVDRFSGQRLSSEIQGAPGSQYRTCTLAQPDKTTLIAIERHGWPGFTPPNNRPQQITSAAKHRQSFAQRRRDGASDAEGFNLAEQLFDAAAADLGRDWACDLFFAAERDYWMNRNAAARVQYQRQQSLGLGWGNHDHHTYRNGRENFATLIALLERMGFECRERFYAGREAGWGAQVLEQPHSGVVIFADVDLTPEEVAGDFAHQQLGPQEHLGTVGLWCKLHGEAFLQAGMHHLECQFDFDAVRPQLAAIGVETMKPFTDWAHLKQAFTKGEVWPVPPERVESALAGGFITPEQAAQFRRDGALGSHLEILERNDGFKGFNQTGISEIIMRTDPRRQNVGA